MAGHDPAAPPAVLGGAGDGGLGGDAEESPAKTATEAAAARVVELQTGRQRKASVSG